MTKENARLIEENYPLYYAYFHRHNIKDEDMRQELIMNLCQRIDSFNPERGKFTTFVFSVFNASVANYIKHTKVQKERLNYESVHLEDTNPGGESEINWHEIIASTEDTIGDYEYELTMNQIFETLSESNKISESVLRVYKSWVRTSSFVDSGKELNMSRQAVQLAVKKVQTYLQSIPDLDWRKI